jgi:hypothetical protein
MTPRPPLATRSADRQIPQVRPSQRPRPAALHPRRRGAALPCRVLRDYGCSQQCRGRAGICRGRSVCPSWLGARVDHQENGRTCWVERAVAMAGKRVHAGAVTASCETPQHTSTTELSVHIWSSSSLSRADGHRRKQHCRPWPSLIPARAPQRACQGVWTSGRVPHTAKPATSTRFATCTRSTGQSKDGSARLRIRRAIAGSVNHDQVDSRVRPSRWPSCERVIHLGVAGRCWWGASLAAGPTVGAWTVACSRRSG